MKLILAVLLLLLSIAMMTAFLLGASLLDQDLPFGLNAGVAAAAISLIIAAIGPMLIFRGTVAKLAFYTALAWLPISVALAGGFQLHYSGWHSIAWLVFTGIAFLAILISWVAALVSRVRATATS